MFDLILIAALGSFGASTQQPAVCREAAPILVAQFRPCVWPNKCAVETPAVAQFQSCVWPHKCSSAADAFSI